MLVAGEGPGPALLVVGALGVLAIMPVRVRCLAVRLALIAVLAGAIGNYAERLFRGYVVDFVHVHHWPVFNLADVYVTAGAALLALLAFSGAGASSGPPPDAARAAAASPR